MSKVSKRYRAAIAMIDRSQHYALNDAASLVKKVSSDDGVKVKFDQTINISWNLNIKARHTIRDTLTFPHPISKERKILVFSRGENADKAKAAGADIVGDDELIAEVKGGFLDFDIAIATPDMMRDVGKLGTVLGPRGLMPNPKTGTVTQDVEQAVKDFKKGKTEFRADKGGNINLAVAKSSFSPEQIRENVSALHAEIMKKKPSDLKGDYIRSVTLAPCMGPGVRVQIQSLGVK